MGISTIYSDSRTVIVDIGSVPATAPWLKQTTYLIDNSGHTTAVLAQTDQPTQGVTITPVPYTSSAQAPTPSNVVDRLPPGWAYRGCYVDDPHSRVLPAQQTEILLITVQECVAMCYQLGYSASGLESSTQCFCGNAIHNRGTLAPMDSDCNFPCSGNASEICGAGSRLSVYSNSTLMTVQPTTVRVSTPTTTAPPGPPGPQVPASAKPQTPTSVIVPASVIGVLTGIALVVGLLHYIRRRIRDNRLQTKNPLQTSQDTSEGILVPSPHVHHESQTGSEDRAIGFWEGNSFGLGIGGNHVVARPRVPELREKYEQLAQAHSSHSDTFVISVAGHPPPRKVPAQAYVGQPTSILKRPVPTESASVARGAVGTEDERPSQGTSATRNIGLAKKGVRFGVNQIREFGRSPFIGYGSES